jgi:LPXTG-motif cell wall-anchored protein
VNQGRIVRRLAAATANSALAALLVVFGAWCAGALATDRWELTQFIFWVPTPAVLAGLVLLGFIAVLLRRRRRRLTAVSAAAAVAACTAVMLIRDLGAINALRPRPHSTQPLRVLTWNISWITDEAAIARGLLSARPDVAILINPSGSLDRSMLYGAFSHPVAVIESAGIIVISAHPIHRSGTQWLGIQLPAGPSLDPRGQGPRRKPIPDPGRAVWFDLHPPSGGAMTVWVLDLPSEPRLSRWTVAHQARAAIESWTGPVQLRDEQGRFSFDQAPGRGFPPADILVGDLNITRGSASLNILAPGMHNACADAGRGWSGTYPRRWPLWHIDQTLLAPGLRALSYRVLDPGIGHHRIQVAEVIPR